MTTATLNHNKSGLVDTRKQMVRQGILRLRCDEARRSFLTTRERRAHQRAPMRRVVYVVPVLLDGDSVSPLEPSFRSTVAYTSDISSHGLAFTHDEPMLAKHVIVTFDLLDDEPVSFMAEIKWAQRRGKRWYCSGGEFVGAVATPEIQGYLPDRRVSLFN